ncbi:hypothetical protein MXB_1816 [Myxobolus squamalis]|nr:hypothetical protein MXB_1816 [Myxobolus squamalis]
MQELYENNPFCIGITFLTQVVDDEQTELLIILFSSIMALLDLISIIKNSHQIKFDKIFQQTPIQLNQSINQNALSNTWINHPY